MISYFALLFTSRFPINAKAHIYLKKEAVNISKERLKTSANLSQSAMEKTLF